MFVVGVCERESASACACVCRVCVVRRVYLYALCSFVCLCLLAGLLCDLTCYVVFHVTCFYHVCSDIDELRANLEELQDTHYSLEVSTAFRTRTQTQA